jgi:hypothetical protein
MAVKDADEAFVRIGRELEISRGENADLSEAEA